MFLVFSLLRFYVLPVFYIFLRINSSFFVNNGLEKKKERKKKIPIILIILSSTKI